MAKPITLKDPITKETLYPITTLQQIYSRDGTQPLLNNLYPIGSVYISVDTKSPADIFGGSWEELPSGNALWTTTTSNVDAGSTISSGLPNIEGSITLLWADTETKGTGAFSVSNGASNRPNAGSAQPFKNYNFDASKSNSIYGNSDIVQPPAYKIYAWKRIA